MKGAIYGCGHGGAAAHDAESLRDCGDPAPSGFTIHLFDPIGSRTLQNGGFSFVVLV